MSRREVPVLHTSRLFTTLLCLAVVGPPLAAGAAHGGPIDRPTAPALEADRPTIGGGPADSLGSGSEPVSGSPAASLDQARELIKDGDYDSAIERIRVAMEEARGDLATLRDAYLLLIKAHVYLGNYQKSQLQGRESANLNYQKARDLIAECLHVRDLRHTRPEPASEYPPEMLALFAEVRNEIFGSFRVLSLQPPSALVTLDGKTLGVPTGDSLLAEVDLETGRHTVVVRAPGYKDVVEDVVIPPSATLARSYRLARKRGRTWYATVSTAAVAAVAGVFAIGRGSSSPPVEEPLPGPPAPPNR